MSSFKCLLLIIVIMSLTSCLKPEEIKTIQWHGNDIKFSVFNGGATTSYFWKIHYKKRFGVRDRLIFESYSTPYIQDISILNGNLIIHCSESKDSTNNIIIDLKNIDRFFGSPVSYKRSVLEKTNKFYIEPDFIKLDRQKAKETGLIK